ncbi:Abi family protein [Allobaculum mucilyticum]|uniref:Abi family protein n=1 Tax=Allobaculum mucilyticum TaxID=2834459 RepID=UPI001E5ABBD8|nr:Abi family protein [Allobaculum mucilyticum]UNT96473.1 Abi family protein [Allobaculum mucilyticum]
MKNNELTKPELSFDEQIEKMEQDRIEFSIISKEEAKDFLQHNNYFFKLKSYTKNYVRNKDGKFSSLVFAYIAELSIVDARFRSIVLDLCLSIEHQLKVMLIRAITNDPQEDGYSIAQELFDRYPYIKENLEEKKHSAIRDLWIHNQETLSV